MLFRSKDTGAPTATLSGQPTGLNNITTLNVTVGGSDVTHYQYKVGLSSIDCSVAAGYSADVIVGTLITDSISGLADGGIKLCVIGRDSSNNYQALASATEATWTKDTGAPTATLSGQPAGLNNTTTLNVTVAGSDVTHYQYKVGLSSIDCSVATGYSTDVTVGTLITNSISGLADGEIGRAHV